VLLHVTGSFGPGGFGAGLRAVLAGWGVGVPNLLGWWGRGVAFGRGDACVRTCSACQAPHTITQQHVLSCFIVACIW
jgi:hypothetical protein